MTKTLREWRIAAGLSKEQLAAQSGVPYPTITRLDAGDSNPQVDNAKKIAKALSDALAQEVHIEDIAWDAKPPVDVETPGKDARAAVA